MDISYFLTDSGRANSSKLKESWIAKNLPQFYIEIKKFSEKNNIKFSKFVELVWYYFNNVTETKICKNKNCNNQVQFIGILHGFLNYCSSRCSNSSEEVKSEKIKSNIKKFGVNNPFQSKEIIQKIKNTNLEKYGVDNPMHSKEIKNKMVLNSLSKTGKKWALSKDGIAHKSKMKNNREKFEKKYYDLKLIEYSDRKFGTCIFYSEKCGHTFSITKWQAYLRHLNKIKICTLCNPIGSSNDTKWQSEFSEFLKQHNVLFTEKDRRVLKPFELDFYLPEHNLAIELNGLYWHSTIFKDSQYHIDKTEKCESQGIQLIHIFEDEWKYKKSIVLSRILNILKKNEVKIFARKCRIQEVSSKESSKFLEENHIQGNIAASKRYGLFFNDELVSIMTFGALRIALGTKSKNGVYEMYRFCNKNGMNIVGGASKLLNAFIKEVSPKSIVSYADRRWSTGNLYRMLGFSEISKTSPNFWYVNGGLREHRFNYTKKKVSKFLEQDSSIISHDDFFAKKSIHRVYDSGNLKFELILPTLT